MNIKLITSTIENAKIQEDIVDFISAIFIFFAVKKKTTTNKPPHLLWSYILLYYKVQRFSSMTS